MCSLCNVPSEGLCTPAEPQPLPTPAFPPAMSELNSEPASQGETAENPYPKVTGKMHKWPVRNSAKQTQLSSGPGMQISLCLQFLSPASLHKAFVPICLISRRLWATGTTLRRGTHKVTLTHGLFFLLCLHILPQINLWGKILPPLWELPPRARAEVGSSSAAPGSSSPALQLLLPRQLESIQTMKYLTGY